MLLKFHQLNNIQFMNNVYNFIILAIVYIYIFDISIRILSRGIIGHKHAFFRVIKNWFDLILTLI